MDTEKETKNTLLQRNFSSIKKVIPYNFYMSEWAVFIQVLENGELCIES